MQHDRSGAVAQVHEEIVNLLRELMTGERPADGLPTFAQHSVLSYISRNPGCRATDISDAFGVHRSTVSRQLRQCVDSGWVHAEAGPVRQGHPLTLTVRGGDVLDDADRDRRAEVDARVRDWQTGDVAEFANLLHHFRSTSTPVRTNTETTGDDHSA
ncbi:winged helix-turn-helix transcriptional regulator [Rhodococcus spelaei]|uniref:Winged helix-turn-helix transcriptional regulator n=1 Tax=Rhodococcus spelaei TaxID=2546320 RepID=A0A541B0K3_9NOCA|nr:MarR family winged helix-turn-helix transcriptional regulator [Rhodococcus spelaei]TQF65830.1 winged helix-turn-helix transcriptional regulator [Rhodococcus spelaei]